MMIKTKKKRNIHLVKCKKTQTQQQDMSLLKQKDTHTIGATDEVGGQ